MIISKQKLADAAKEIVQQAGCDASRVQIVSADISEFNTCVDMVKKAEELQKGQPIDILVACAGGSSA